MQYPGQAVFLQTDLTSFSQRQMADFVGITHEELPALFAYKFVSMDDSEVFKLPTKDLTKVSQATLEKFANGFFAKKLRRFYKSEPIPQNSDSYALKKVVGKTFVDVVLDPKKDVLFMTTARNCY